MSTQQADLELVCPGQHSWRVVGFDFADRIVVERCHRCGTKRERVAVAKVILDNDYYRKVKK